MMFVDDLGSLDKTKEVFWQDSYEITLNGHILFKNGGILPNPESGDDIWQAFVDVLARLTSINPV
jgi:hypothetical protein